jgi:drug/metabolite transporter (DMT)-like permease
MRLRGWMIGELAALFTAVAGFIFFHEKLSTKTVLGAITIVAGVSLIFLV